MQNRFLCGAVARMPLLIVCFAAAFVAQGAPGSTGTWEPGRTGASTQIVEPIWPLVLGLGLTMLSRFSRKGDRR